MSQNELEESCAAIYRQIAAFFATIERKQDFGFKIFNSPPKHRPSFLFVGYQPGGSEGSHQYETERGTHLRWPGEIEYLTAEWALARRMRSMFGDALADCVGMNAIFLRYPSVASYRAALEPSSRKVVERFCTAIVDRVVDLIEPKKIVTIGFSALELFGPTNPQTQNTRGRILTRSGQIGNREAIAMLHLTGARISNEDRDLIRECVLKN